MPTPHALGRVCWPRLTAVSGWPWAPTRSQCCSRVRGWLGHMHFGLWWVDAFYDELLPNVLHSWSAIERVFWAGVLTHTYYTKITLLHASCRVQITGPSACKLVGGLLQPCFLNVCDIQRNISNLKHWPPCVFLPLWLEFWEGVVLSLHALCLALQTGYKEWQKLTMCRNVFQHVHNCALCDAV